jgi:predicted flap endonuclease-1-like 5' DNA nuclease
MTEGTQAITAIHFALMALLALVAIAAIVWGVRAKHRRKRADEAFEAHAEEAGVPIADVTSTAPLVEDPAPPIAASSPPAPSPTPPPVTVAPVEEPAPPTPVLVDEPIPAAIPPHENYAALAADADEAAAPSPADGPVTQIKGLGPKVAARLGDLGITRVGQLAALDPAGATALDAQLGPFTGRMARDRWIEQARLLAAGDRAGFERLFGRL